MLGSANLGPFKVLMQHLQMWCVSFQIFYTQEIVQLYGTTVGNLVMICFIFTILIKIARHGPVILHAFQGARTKW